MKIEIAKHDRMSESGSSLLRLIQNKEIPLLDLLARESVQNALDAAAADTKAVSVDFSTGVFDPKIVNAHLMGIESGLNKKYGRYIKQQYIMIRDSGTQGLTGPIRYSEVEDNSFGNLLKLIYEISKPQQTEGAGGSWGLGKTVYFRIGIGLVIYYSRILVDGEYISRMAACMVEDETKDQALIPAHGKLKRGIAWWGADDGDNRTVPLENDPEIDQILQAFGIEPYQGEETGTTIIIPYVDDKKLLDEVYPQNEEENKRPYWTKAIDEYLSVAVQKWYAPRISNRDYKYGAFLRPTINGKLIATDRMLPLYRIVRELYISSVTGRQTDYWTDMGITVYQQSIDLRKVLEKQTAGTLVCVKVTREQLGMNPPDNNKSPYQQISNTEVISENGNSPIIMYTRRPGMIVGYDYSGSWTHSMPRTPENEYVIGIFVLNSDNMLSFTDKKHSMTLDEYIRQGEKADHASWNDHNIYGYNERIVLKIQKNVIRKVSSQYKEQSRETVEKRPTGLSQALADILLPTNNFGKKPTNNGSNGSSGSGSGTSHSSGRTSFEIIGSPSYAGQDVIYEYQITARSQECILSLVLNTEQKDLTADKWEKEDEADKAFPISIRDFTLTESQPINKQTVSNHDLSVTGLSSDTDYSLEPIASSRFGILYAIKVKSGSPKTVFKGKVRVHSDAPYFKISFSIKETSYE